MRAFLNTIINLLKWPVALVFLWFLPGFAATFFEAWLRLGQASRRTWPLWVAAGVFVFLYRQLWRQSKLLQYLWTFEHELTHAIFAWLTGHRVTKFRVRAGTGVVNYQGPGNWLIRVAPYFFPLMLLGVLATLLILGRTLHPVGLAVLGVAFASTILHMIQEFHPGQPDLHDVSLPFAWFFVPASNFATWGLFLLFVLHGRAGASVWWKTTVHYNRAFWALLGITF